MLVLLFVHVKVPPGGVLVKVDPGTVVPGFTVMFEPVLVVGKGLTVIV
jgi:hypothetical protein